MIKKVLFNLAIIATLVACNSKEKKKEQILIGQKNTSQQKSAKEMSMEEGGKLYTDFCMQCHMANGKGVPGSFPPLANSNWLTDKRTESIHSVKYGLSGEIEVNGEIYNNVMVPMGLSDKEIADVMNYVMNSWGNTQDKLVTEEEVAAVAK